MDIENGTTSIRHTTTENTTATTSKTKVKFEYLSLMDKLEIMFNFLNHLIICFITIYMTYICVKNGFTNTSVHALLLTLGYQLLMAEGILCLYTNNILSMQLLNKREDKVNAHWILLLTGSILAITGTFYKVARNGPHFYSIHAITGITSTIILFFNLLTGLTAIYSTTLRSFISPIYNKTFHMFLGLIGFIIGMVSFYYGFNTGYLRRKIETDFIILMKVLIIITIILTCFNPLRALLRNIRNIFI